jgi:hypothetical protein
MARLGDAGRQPPRDAALGRDGPEVVLADEDDGVVVDRG